MAGESLLTIGLLVGHKNPASTKRYTHLDTSATEVTGNILNNKYYKKGWEMYNKMYNIAFLSVFNFLNFTAKRWYYKPWAISSAGRATALQAVGHKFEPCIAHHFPRITGS